MTLHAEPVDVLFIHGWGMHGGMWGGVLDTLAKQHRVLTVDLPGYGTAVQGEEGRGTGENVSLDAIVDQLSAQYTGPLNLCGWSLGAKIALRWAMREPSKIKKLLLVAPTPCFVQRPGWDTAMAGETLAEFSASLQQDAAQTLRRFLALQVRGGEREREMLLLLRKLLQSRDLPDSAALNSGLDMLRDVDLREELGRVAQPALVLAGSCDTLIPPAASRYLAEHLPCARYVQIEGAAHVPFLSHAEEFVKLAVDFLDE